MEEKNLQKIKWTASEEDVFVDLVLGNEDLLFGALKGANVESIRRSRTRCWEEIAQQLNSRFVNSKKDVACLKKKFSNIKQRAKAKLDNAKSSRAKTGGGPQAPQCTPAEQTLLSCIGERPSVSGVTTGVDTDSCTYNTECIGNDESESSGTSQHVRPVSNSSVAVSTAECASSSANAGTKPVSSTAGSKPQCESSSSFARNDVKQTKEKKRKFKTLREKIEEQTLINIQLDNKRIEREMEIQDVKLKKMKLKIELMQQEKIFCQLKMQSEFNIVVQNDE